VDLTKFDTIHITETTATPITYSITLPSYYSSIFTILKAEDVEIGKLLNGYIPNSDIDELSKGTLTSVLSRAKDLYNKSHYAEAADECNVDVINKIIKKYETLLEDHVFTHPNAEKANPTDTYYASISGTISDLKLKIAKLEAYDSSIPNNKQCEPALTVPDAESIMDGIYLNYITKIIQTQETAIQTIIKSKDTEIINFYQSFE
jgi:hypothetical protein